MVCTLSVETAKPETAAELAGVNCTPLLTPFAPTLRLSALRATVLLARLPWAVAVIVLLLRVTAPSTVTAVAPTVADITESSTLAKVVTVLFFCMFSNTLEAVMLPMLAV